MCVEKGGGFFRCSVSFGDRLAGLLYFFGRGYGRYVGVCWIFVSFCVVFAF